MTAKELLDQLPNTDWTTSQLRDAEQTLAAALQAYGDELVAQERKEIAAMLLGFREKLVIGGDELADRLTEDMMVGASAAFNRAAARVLERGKR